MSTRSMSIATEWIAGIIKEHSDEQTNHSWSGFPDKPTLHIADRNLRITFPPAVIADCAHPDSVHKESVKNRLITIMRDVKVRDYKNQTFCFNEQSGYSVTHN